MISKGPEKEQRTQGVSPPEKVQILRHTGAPQTTPLCDHARATVSTDGRWGRPEKWLGSGHELGGVKQRKNSRIKHVVLKVQLLPEGKKSRPYCEHKCQALSL